MLKLKLKLFVLISLMVLSPLAYSYTKTSKCLNFHAGIKLLKQASGGVVSSDKAKELAEYERLKKEREELAK